MKKFLIGISICATAFIVSNLFAQDFTKHTLREQGSPMPEIKIIDKNDHFHTNKEMKADATTFLFLFNPTCSHCINMGKAMGTNETAFKDCNVWFISAPDTKEYLDHFYKETGADSFHYMVIGADTSGIIQKIYGYGMLPQLNIYSKKDHRLLKTFSGDTEIDSIKAYIGR